MSTTRENERWGLERRKVQVSDAAFNFRILLQLQRVRTGVRC